MPQHPIIPRIPHMTPEQRYATAKNATLILADGDHRQSEAEAILAAIDAHEISSFEQRRRPHGPLDWEPHDGQYVMRGFHDGKVVATITYTDTHTSSRKNVYALRVGGVEQGDLFHHVEEAREAAARLFCDLGGVS